MSRKHWTMLTVLGVAATVAGVFLIVKTSPASATSTVIVYKSPTCGCCTKWVQYMRRRGYRVETHDVREMGAVKGENGIPGTLQSCHTAVVDGYVVEGHVPADVIEQLLAERPPAVGIAVPGMPEGSPGMEGTRWERYDVLLFDRAGGTRVYAQR